MPCPTCASLPQRLDIANSEGEPLDEFPEAVGRLGHDEPALYAAGLRECPGCGDLFWYASHVPGGSEDYARTWYEESLQRVSRDEAVQRLEGELATLARLSRFGGVWVERHVALGSALSRFALNMP